MSPDTEPVMATMAPDVAVMIAGTLEPPPPPDCGAVTTTTMGGASPSDAAAPGDGVTRSGDGEALEGPSLGSSPGRTPPGEVVGRTDLGGSGVVMTTSGRSALDSSRSPTDRTLTRPTTRPPRAVSNAPSPARAPHRSWAAGCRPALPFVIRPLLPTWGRPAGAHHSDCLSGVGGALPLNRAAPARRLGEGQFVRVGVFVGEDSRTVEAEVSAGRVLDLCAEDASRK